MERTSRSSISKVFLDFCIHSGIQMQIPNWPVRVSPKMFQARFIYVQICTDGQVHQLLLSRHGASHSRRRNKMDEFFYFPRVWTVIIQDYANSPDPKFANLGHRYREERWRSEGVQIGGPCSGRGVLGTWFDKYAHSIMPEYPFAYGYKRLSYTATHIPTAYWAVSSRHAVPMTKQISLSILETLIHTVPRDQRRSGNLVTMWTQH